MFEKREVMSFQGVNPGLIIPQIVNYWSQAGYYVTQNSPTQISGVAYQEEMAIKPKFNLIIVPQGPNTLFDITMSADVGTNGIIILILLCVFFWPLALVLGFVAYDKHEKNSKAMMYNFWGFIGHITGQAPMPPQGPYGQAPPPPPQY